MIKNPLKVRKLYKKKINLIKSDNLLGATKMSKLWLLFILFEKTLGNYQQDVIFHDVKPGMKKCDQSGRNVHIHVATNEEGCRMQCLRYFDCSGYSIKGTVCELDFTKSNDDENDFLIISGWKYVRKTIIKVRIYIIYIII